MFVSKVSQETKQEILVKVRSGERVALLAKQYGISDKTIYGWLRADTGEEVVSVLKYNRLKRENEELKWLVGELTLDLKREKKDWAFKTGPSKTIRSQHFGGVP